MIPWKLVDAVFGKLWLLIIPIILVPLVTVTMTRSEPEYTSRANIWVSRPDDVDTGVLLRTAPYWESPAQAQANVMGDLLSTDSFRAAVAADAGIQGPEAEDRVGSAVSISASGNNLISVAAQTPDPADAPAIVTAIISEYQNRETQAASETASLQVDYFTTQLSLATEELEARQETLFAYEAENPAPESGVRANDVQHNVLVSSVESQQLIVDSILEALQEAQRDAAAAPQALAATFNVQDPASDAEMLGVSMTQRFGYPVAALLFGVAISATYLYVVYRTDHAIRTSQDLTDLPVPLLGFVPQLRRRGEPGLLNRAPLRWFNPRRNRDYARSVAASMSHTTPGEAAS